MLTKRRACWMTLVVTVMCTGCAASPGVNVGAQPATGGGARDGTKAPPRLIGSAAIDGAYEASGTFTGHPQVLVGHLPQVPTAHDTCVDYAKGFAQNPTGFVAPEVKTAGVITLYVTTTLASGYHGPGTYSSATSPMLSGQVTVGVGDLNGAGYIDTLRSGFPGTTTLTVDADGSGTLVFSSWGSDATIISGTVKWVCR